MKLSSQKVAGLIGAATILTLVVSVVTPAAAQVSSGATFTRNLTIGSTGADVTALQTWLATKGFFTVTPTGYFGPITQKALAAYQASVGISPAAGYFGPITMAQIAQGGGVAMTGPSSVPGCAAGAMFSATTGAPCTSTSSVPGCAAGAMFSATTGAPCTSGVTSLPAGCVVGSAFSSTTGVACTPTSVTGNGVLTVTQDPAVVTNTNITSYSNVPIYGLQLQAQLGSVNVSQLTLAVTDLVNGANYENPGAFISSVSIVDASTNAIIYTEPVTPANFITNPDGTTAFYIQLSGFNFVVPANSTKDIVVEANTSATIDQSRALTVKGYNSNSLQYFTGNNIVNYQDISGISVSSTFNTSSNVSVVVGVDPSNPVAGTQYINSSSGAQGVILLAFNAQSSNGTVNVINASTSITTTGTAPTAVYLYNGSQELAAVSPSNTSGTTYVTFNGATFSDAVTANTTKVFTIRADFPSSTTNGSIVKATLNTLVYNTSGGLITTVSPSGIAGNNQALYQASSNLKITGTATVVAPNPQYSGATSTASVTFPLSVTPEPGQETQPTIGDFLIAYGTTSSSVTAVSTSSLGLSSFSPSVVVTSTFGSPVTQGTALSQGSTYTFNLSATINVSGLTHGTNYYFWLMNASTSVASSTGGLVTQAYTTATLPNNQSPVWYNP